MLFIFSNSTSPAVQARFMILLVRDQLRLGYFVLTRRDLFFIVTAAFYIGQK